jgi:hypothetical protein
MKERITYRKLFLFKLYECDALKEYIQEMALKGWMLKDIKTYLTFEKAEPQKIIYSVEVFDKASMYDSRLEDKALEYVDYCVEAGWEFVCTSGKIHVFKTKDENTAPIETDERQKYKTIISGTIKQNFIQWFILPVIFTFNTYISSLNFERFVTTNLDFAFLLIFMCFIIVNVSQIVNFIIWIKKSRDLLKTEERTFSFNKEDLKRRNRIRFIPLGIILSLVLLVTFASFIGGDMLTGAMMIAAILVVAGILMFLVWLQKESFGRMVNIVIPIAVASITAVVLPSVIIIFVIFLPTDNSNSKVINIKEGNSVYSHTVYNDKIPLTLADFGIKTKKYSSKSKSTDQSIFASITNYSDSNFTIFSRDGDEPGNDEVNINYDVFDSKFDFIIDHYLEQKLDWENEAGIILKKDSLKFNAKEIYTGKKMKYGSEVIIVFDKRVITFYSDIRLNNNQIKIICEKLAPT